MVQWVRRHVDLFLVGMVVAIVLATVLPARGVGAEIVHGVVTVAIAVLFFLYGVRLSPQAVADGFRAWRLHLTVLAVTFAVFPLLGVALGLIPDAILSPQLYAGVLFLCLLPSTVQSSIAFTSIAGGNVAGAVCAASFSSLLGVVITPLLAALLLRSQVQISADLVLGVLLQLLLPFALGQLCRRWLWPTVAKHPRLTTVVDRGSVLLIIYAAFAEAVVAGLWSRLSPGQLGTVVVIDIVLLAAALLITTVIGRRLRFDRADRIVILFCGSKKSMAVGLPLAGLLFAGSSTGLLVVPMMIFHQIQLLVCAWLARRLRPTTVA